MKMDRHNSVDKGWGHFFCTKPTRRITGLSLVELMVAITIGLIILTALTRLFVTSRSTYTLEEGLARVQENARFAMEFLAQDIRMAGFSGCLGQGAPVSVRLNNPDDYLSKYSEPVSGHTYTGTGGSSLTDWTPALPGTVNGIIYFAANEVMPFTDIIVVRHGDETGFQVQPPAMTTTAAALQIPTSSGLEVGDILMVSDCKGGDVFQITGPANPDASGTLNHNAGAGTPGNTNQALSRSYGTDSTIMKLVTRIYYISKRGGSVTSTAAAAIPPALFRKELDKNAFAVQEMVEGIERLQFSYGEDAESDKVPNYYRAANNVGSWPKVVTVRVGLLARTIENVEANPDTRTYDLAGNSVEPFNDKARRRAFNSTIHLRNHF